MTNVIDAFSYFLYKAFKSFSFSHLETIEIMSTDNVQLRDTGP